MKEIFKNLAAANKLVGAVGLVVSDNQIKEQLAYGRRSLEDDLPISIDTVFRIASISKIIVALGIMKLVEAGRLDINTDVSEYLGFRLRNPYHPEVPITLTMIMTQTSSITDGFDDENIELGYNGVNGRYQYVSLEELLIPGGKYYIEETFDMEIPGSNFIYANFNSGIMACIIERVTGKYFVDYIREEILLPLGLDASFDIKDIKTNNIASLYINEAGELGLVRDYQLFMKKRYEKYQLGNNFRGPAGGLFISPRDLSVIMRMLMNQGAPIFKSETIMLMLSKHWEGTPKYESYYRAKGLQVLLLDYYDDKLLKGHFGDAYGLRSLILFNEAKQIGFIYMTNGGYYKRNPIGIDNVQDALIKAFLAKYWD